MKKFLRFLPVLFVLPASISVYAQSWVTGGGNIVEPTVASNRMGVDLAPLLLTVIALMVVATIAMGIRRVVKHRFSGIRQFLRAIQLMSLVFILLAPLSVYAQAWVTGGGNIVEPSVAASRSGIDMGTVLLGIIIWIALSVVSVTVRRMVTRRQLSRQTAESQL